MLSVSPMLAPRTQQDPMLLDTALGDDDDDDDDDDVDDDDDQPF